MILKIAVPRLIPGAPPGQFEPCVCVWELAGFVRYPLSGPVREKINLPVEAEPRAWRGVQTWARSAGKWDCRTEVV